MSYIHTKIDEFENAIASINAKICGIELSLAEAPRPSDRARDHLTKRDTENLERLYAADQNPREKSKQLETISIQDVTNQILDRLSALEAINEEVLEMPSIDELRASLPEENWITVTKQAKDYHDSVKAAIGPNYSYHLAAEIRDLVPMYDKVCAELEEAKAQLKSRVGQRDEQGNDALHWAIILNAMARAKLSPFSDAVLAMLEMAPITNKREIIYRLRKLKADAAESSVQS